MPLVEIVPAPWTHPDIPGKTKAIMTEIGQKPVVFSKEIDGFALNRIQYVIGHLACTKSSSNVIVIVIVRPSSDTLYVKESMLTGTQS